MLTNLMRPKEFQRRNREFFNTYSALRYYLDRRHENGLIESGAVIETPLGLRIDIERFPAWLLGKATQHDRAAA